MSTIPSGWPCAALPTTPPSVADLEAQPTADGLLTQILALTPRGPAWGTDEVGDGRGASPVQRSVWRALAAWAADHLGLDWQAATQTFPTAITYTLPDWERELGLPDPCFSGTGGVPARLAAVRARFAAIGGQSPAYFICLAASIGYAITITEFRPFQFGRSSFGGPRGQFMKANARHTWRVKVTGRQVKRFQFGKSSFGRDSFLAIQRAQDLECILQRLKPAQTTLIFDYSGA